PVWACHPPRLGQVPAEAGTAPLVEVGGRLVELGEVQAHAGRLTALTWEDERNTHGFVWHLSGRSHRVPANPTPTSASGPATTRSIDEDGRIHPLHPPGCPQVTSSPHPARPGPGRVPVVASGPRGPGSRLLSPPGVGRTPSPGSPPRSRGRPGWSRRR